MQNGNERIQDCEEASKWINEMKTISQAHSAMPSILWDFIFTVLETSILSTEVFLVFLIYGSALHSWLLFIFGMHAFILPANCCHIKCIAKRWVYVDNYENCTSSKEARNDLKMNKEKETPTMFSYLKLSMHSQIDPNSTKNRIFEMVTELQFNFNFKMEEMFIMKLENFY